VARCAAWFVCNSVANSFPQPMPAGIGAAFDPASHKCSMMHSQPVAPMKSMGGPYKTKAEAHKAMAS
jgi:hypothetical protein